MPEDVERIPVLVLTLRTETRVSESSARIKHQSYSTALRASALHRNRPLPPESIKGGVPEDVERIPVKHRALQCKIQCKYNDHHFRKSEPKPQDLAPRVGI